MTKAAASDTIPYFFLISEKYTLGTPIGIAASERTIDLPFWDLAKSYDIQEVLKLASAAFIKPAWNPPLAYPLADLELINATASYLAAFANEAKESKKRRDYLVDNGLIRILVTDNRLMERINEIQEKQTRAEVQQTLKNYEVSWLFSVPREAEHCLGYDIKVRIVWDRVGTDFLTNQPIFTQRKIVIIE